MEADAWCTYVKEIERLKKEDGGEGMLKRPIRRNVRPGMGILAARRYGVTFLCMRGLPAGYLLSSFLVSVWFY